VAWPVPVNGGVPPLMKTAYVASTTGTLTPITIVTGKAGKAIKAGSDPAALAISANDALHRAQAIARKECFVPLWLLLNYV
jgi:hypothetical protein